MEQLLLQGNLYLTSKKSSIEVVFENQYVIVDINSFKSLMDFKRLVGSIEFLNLKSFIMSNNYQIDIRSSNGFIRFLGKFWKYFI